MKDMVGGCCVCSDENGWPGNPLVYCDGPGCEVAVHQGCYGIIEVPEGEWYCAKCGASPSHYHNGGSNGVVRQTPASCELCPFGYGALKRTQKGGWAHVICALYIPEVKFGDVNSMQPVITTDVPQERFDKPCYICSEAGNRLESAQGACMNCNRTGCRRSFHVTCAQRRGYLCEQGGGSENVKYCGYCDHHLKKAALDPTIKIVPPCRVRPLASSRVPLSTPVASHLPSQHQSHQSHHHPPQPTPPPSNHSGQGHLPHQPAGGVHLGGMLVDPLPRTDPHSVLGVAAGSVAAAAAAAVSEEGGSHLLNTFSPPLTSSSRSSVALDTTPPLSGVKTEPVGLAAMQQSPLALAAPLHNSFNALVSAAVAVNQHSELTNHNRLLDSNGDVKPEMKGPTVGEVVSAVTLPKTHVKRHRDLKEGGERAKRPRPSNSSRSKGFKELLDAVGPVVSETVSDFQRERVADKAAAEQRRVAAASAPGPSTAPSDAHAASGLVACPPPRTGRRTPEPQPTALPAPSVPSSMEQLLERQWEQGSQFLMNQAHFDVAQLLSCLHQLKNENVRLEEQQSTLVRRREHLLALNTRLSTCLSAPPPAAPPPPAAAPPPPVPVSLPPPAAVQPPPAALPSPHHSPRTSNPADDSLNQLRSLAGRRPPSQQQQQLPPSSPFVQTPPQQRAEGVSPERMLGTGTGSQQPLLQSAFLGRQGTGGFDPLLTQLLLSQAQQQQMLSQQSTASLLARFMLPGMQQQNK